MKKKKKFIGANSACVVYIYKTCAGEFCVCIYTQFTDAYGVCIGKFLDKKKLNKNNNDHIKSIILVFLLFSSLLPYISLCLAFIIHYSSKNVVYTPSQPKTKNKNTQKQKKG